MNDRVEATVWPQAYIDGYRRAAGMLMGIRRRRERANACLKVLLDAATSLTSRAPAAIDAPSAAHANALAEIAGAAWAARAVIEYGSANLDMTADSRFLDWLIQRSAPWGGRLASPLMAASDGDLRTLLREGAVPQLEAGVQAGRAPDASWLVQPAYTIDHAAAFLAELNASAQRRPAAALAVSAEELDKQIASTSPVQSAHISAHAFAVHYLTGINGPGESNVRITMLRLVATHPPRERATLQASKVAALLSDAGAHRARMALLDHILILLGPHDYDPSVRTAIARDCALVLLLLEADGVERPDLTDIPRPVAETLMPAHSRSQQAEEDASARGVEAAPHADTGGTDGIAEIAREAERAIATRAAERQARYQRAVDAGSLADALSIACDAVVDDDHEQAWLLLQDIARRHPEADPNDLVTVAPDVLGPVALDSDEQFEGPGAGCFTVLSPTPAEAAAGLDRVAARLFNVDDAGSEHPDSEIARTAGAYTPNNVYGVVWCDRGAQVSLDTKGSMSAPMTRTMLAIITHALIEDRVPALVTGWIPSLDARMTRWASDD